MIRLVAALTLSLFSGVATLGCAGHDSSILTIDNQSEMILVLTEDGGQTDLVIEPRSKRELVIYDFKGEITWGVKPLGATEDLDSETVTFKEMEDRGGVTFTIE